MRPGYRQVEGAAGCIEIDGIDIATVPLQTLRSRISIIPQVRCARYYYPPGRSPRTTDRVYLARPSACRPTLLLPG